MQRSRLAVVLGAVLAALLLPAATRALADDRTVQSGFGPATVEDKYPKLDSTLGRLVDTRAGGGLVQVEAVARTARRTDLEAAIRAAGGRISGRYAGLVEARVPADSLEALAAHPGARRLRSPVRPQPQVVSSEGIASTGAAPWHSAQTTGAGVEIAIVDVGFAGWKTLPPGELPGQVVTADFCGPGLFEADDHGTAVAELVHDVAPAAKLHLVCIDTLTSLGQAKDYVVANDIPIVNHSIGWLNTSRGDTTGSPESPTAIVADARAEGVLWVNAVGNYAENHWSGTFSDSDADQYHNFAGPDNGNQVTLAESGCVFLKWDDWPVSDQDFDLELRRTSDDDLVAASTGLQNGTQEPYEEFCYSDLELDDYYVAIASDGATAMPRLDLFVTEGQGLEFADPAGSIIEPASSPAALAVGATCWQSGALEPYSSRGPTIDGRVKPDLSGPDAVSSVTYDAASSCNAGFAGTSASSPHVAGAAALLRQANPALSVEHLQAALEAKTVDLGPPGKDNDTGSGRLALGTAPSPPAAAPTNASLPTISGTFHQGQTLSASDGAWTSTPAPALGFRWLRCDGTGAACAAIEGARSKTYVPTALDVGRVLKVRVTASNPGGSAQVVSDGTPQIQTAVQAPANVIAPSLAGVAQMGQTLSASSGAWSGTGPLAITIAWLRCSTDGACGAIPGAISATYQLGPEDVGMNIRIRVTASNAGGTEAVTSDASGTVLPPAPGLVSPPSITGLPQEGQTLTASTGGWTFASTFSFQWRRCTADGTCTDIPGARAATFVLGSSEAGFRLQVVVTASNAAGAGSSASALSAGVSRAPRPPMPPPPQGGGTQSRLTVLGFSRSPRTPRAGRTFALVLRVGTRVTSARRATLNVRCTASVGGRALRATSKNTRAGVARCAWSLPRTAAGKRLRSTIVVSEGARSVRRSLTATVRRRR